MRRNLNITQATNAVVEQVSENKIYENAVGVGHSMSHKTMDALEAVGKRAMDMLMQHEVNGVCALAFMNYKCAVESISCTFP